MKPLRGRLRVYHPPVGSTIHGQVVRHLNKDNRNNFFVLVDESRWILKQRIMALTMHKGGDAIARLE